MDLEAAGIAFGGHFNIVTGYLEISNLTISNDTVHVMMD